MKKPELADFCLRGLPADVAVEAHEKWDSLTKVEREALGFKDDYSPLTDYLRSKGVYLQTSPIAPPN